MTLKTRVNPMDGAAGQADGSPAAKGSRAPSRPSPTRSRTAGGRAILLALGLLGAGGLTVSAGASSQTLPGAAGLTYRAELPLRPDLGIAFSCAGESCADADRLSCEAAAPVLCLHDINAPGPAGLEDGSWSAGVIALSRAVRGKSLWDNSAADEICQSEFGGDWRAASLQDGRPGAIRGYGQPALVGSRAWVVDRRAVRGECG